MKVFKYILLVGSLALNTLVFWLFYNLMKPIIVEDPGISKDLSGSRLPLILTSFTFLLGLMCSLSLFRQIRSINSDLKLYNSVRGFFPLSQILCGFWIIGWSAFGIMDLIRTTNLTDGTSEDYFDLLLVYILCGGILLLGIGLIIDFFLGRKISKNRLAKVDTSLFGSEVKKS